MPNERWLMFVFDNDDDANEDDATEDAREREESDEGT